MERLSVLRVKSVYVTRSRSTLARQRCGRLSVMDESNRRRLSIAKELVTWGIAMPSLLAGISEALKRTSLTGRQKLDFEVMARRITTSFNAIGETPDDKTADAALYEQFIENTDCLREQIAAAKAALVRVAKQPRG
jgi:hypothetical protein